MRLTACVSQHAPDSMRLQHPSYTTMHRAESKIEADGTRRPSVPREQLLTDDMDLPGADVPPPQAAPLGCGALPADQVPWVAETWALLRRFQGAVGMQTLPSLHALEVQKPNTALTRAVTDSQNQLLITLFHHFIV